MSVARLTKSYFAKGGMLGHLVHTGRCCLCDQPVNHQGEAPSSTDDRSEQRQDGPTSEEEIKKKILEASLPHVHDLGWTNKTIAAGAESLGLPGVSHGMFPRGGVELAHYFYASSNQTLAQRLAAENAQAEADGTPKKRTGEFIASALEERLRMTIPYLDRWPQAMALFATPQNAPEAFRNLATLCDDIWYHAGDRSTDFNYYTKRATLAAVYKSTELYLLQDSSDDFQQTWAFMDRRLGDLQTAGKLVRQMQTGTDNLGDMIFGGLHIARNVLGMNDQKR